MTLVALSILAAAAAALALARHAFLIVVVHGNSMAPAYHDGDRLLVRRRTHMRWRAGDVAVFSNPSHDPALLVKRVVAVPGDAVPDDVRAVVGGLNTVPDGCLVVRGDAVRSSDSRVFGFVTLESTMGVVARPLALAPRESSRRP